MTETGRRLARAALAAFGGTPQVRQYLDEDERHAVDILACADRPVPGFTSYSTLSLHAAEAEVRVELAGVAATSAEAFPNLLATAAFFVMKDRWPCAPGVVFPSLLDEYALSDTLHHVLWAPPFAWDQLSRVDAGDGGTVHWLLAVPISDGERRYLDEHGFDALEELFAAHEVEYYDVERAPVV